MSDSPEQLWAKAHEHVRRGDFATAVRHLAQCFQLLQAANDPRVYEVHKRWTEVHKMYLEDGARQQQPPAQKAPSVEAEAETAANAGDLDRAIALYHQAAAQQPHNELVRERLQELTNAKRRAIELSTGTAPRTSAPVAAVSVSPTAATSPPTPAQPVQAQPAVQPVVAAVQPVVAAVQPVVAAAQPVVAAVQPVVAAVQPARATAAKSAEDDWSEVSIDEGEASATAPAMAVDDAPVGMQSLDVPFSVGASIDAFQADDLPVAGVVTGVPAAASVPASAAATVGASAATTRVSARGGVGEVAFLEELLARVQANRRPSA